LINPRNEVEEEKEEEGLEFGIGSNYTEFIKRRGKEGGHDAKCEDELSLGCFIIAEHTMSYVPVSFNQLIEQIRPVEENRRMEGREEWETGKETKAKIDTLSN